MPTVSMKDLLQSGVHFGHQTRRWNPKMRSYIFSERGGIYIIDLQKTTVLIDEAYSFLRNVAARGGSVLFVGTKKQCQEAIKEEAEAAGQPYVATRWLGGLLTNYVTLSKRIKRLHELRQLVAEGSIDVLPTRDQMKLRGELAKLETNLGGVAGMESSAERRVRGRSAQRGDRRQGGAQAGHPARRARRHELRPRRGRLRHPRQRRRHPLVLGDRQGHGARGRRRSGAGHARPSSRPPKRRRPRPRSPPRPKPRSPTPQRPPPPRPWPRRRGRRNGRCRGRRRGRRRRSGQRSSRRRRRRPPRSPPRPASRLRSPRSSPKPPWPRPPWPTSRPSRPSRPPCASRRGRRGEAVAEAVESRGRSRCRGQSRPSSPRPRPPRPSRQPSSLPRRHASKPAARKPAKADKARRRQKPAGEAAGEQSAKKEESEA